MTETTGRRGKARHAIAATLSLAVSALVISFCGGGDSSSTTPTPPVSAPVQGACGFTVSQNQTSQTIGATGGSVTIPVTATAGCNWTARSNDAFLTITDAGSGNGNGSVVVAVTANTGGGRSGTLLIAGVTFTINQDAAPCAFALGGDTSRTFGAGGGSGRITVTVTQGANCTWSATSNASFITITSPANGSGTGNGNVDFTVAANSGGSRTGTLTIASRPITVAQDGIATTTTSSTTTTTVPATTTAPPSSTTTGPSTTTTSVGGGTSTSTTSILFAPVPR